MNDRRLRTSWPVLAAAAVALLSFSSHPASAGEGDTAGSACPASAKACPTDGSACPTSAKACPTDGSACPATGTKASCPDKSSCACRQQTSAYPLDACPMSGKKLGAADTHEVRTYDGREVRFCGAGCAATFEKDLEANLGALDQTIIDTQKPDYPLTQCLVSGAELGSMGAGYDHVHDNQLVRFCCKGCLKTFKQDPDKYLGTLSDAYSAIEGGTTTAAAKP